MPATHLLKIIHDMTNISRGFFYVALGLIAGLDALNSLFDILKENTQLTSDLWHRKPGVIEIVNKPS